MADAVVRQVDETNLHTLGALTGDVEKTYLHAVERVGIVDGTPLPATHHARRDIQQTRQLQAAVHALGDVADTTELETTELVSRRIGDARQLQTTAAIDSHGRDDAELQTLDAILRADNAYRKLLR